MWQISMEDNFWITLSSSYESLDSLVHSLEVQHEGGPGSVCGLQMYY